MATTYGQLMADRFGMEVDAGDDSAPAEGPWRSGLPRFWRSSSPGPWKFSWPRRVVRATIDGSWGVPRRRGWS